MEPSSPGREVFDSENRATAADVDHVVSTEDSSEFSDIEDPELLAEVRSELMYLDDEDLLDETSSSESDSNAEDRYDLARTAAHEYLGQVQHVSRCASSSRTWLPANHDHSSHEDVLL